MKKQDTYYLFVDESGESNLNYIGSKYFVLSTILIKKNDFPIIEGYLRLLKRKFLGDDFKNIHTTDLFERPYQNYRKLLKPRKNIYSFIDELRRILVNTPYYSGLYYVDKDKLRTKINYSPSKKKTNEINIELPYELCALEAIKDFTRFLITKKSSGEITIESRKYKDANFVNYFDIARTQKDSGGIINPLYRQVSEYINSLIIANKRIVNGGLEIADICAYATYRHFNGDPKKKVKIDEKQIKALFNAMKQHTYIHDQIGRKIKEVV